MFGKRRQKELSNSEKIHHFYRADRLRRLRQGSIFIVPFVVIFMMSFTNGRGTEVLATATDANISYRTNANHQQQVALEDGSLLMIKLPHEITLTPGERVLLSKQTLIVFGLKRYHFVALSSDNQSVINSP